MDKGYDSRDFGICILGIAKQMVMCWLDKYAVLEEVERPTYFKVVKVSRVEAVPKQRKSDSVKAISCQRFQSMRWQGWSAGWMVEGPESSEWRSKGHVRIGVAI